MTLPVPKLDTTDFARLIEEARGLIPRYAPDWTDHNLHDPGITLLELLAWITDQDIYRLGLVGDERDQTLGLDLRLRELVCVTAEARCASLIANPATS